MNSSDAALFSGVGFLVSLMLVIGFFVLTSRVYRLLKVARAILAEMEEGRRWEQMQLNELRRIADRLDGAEVARHQPEHSGEPD